MLKISTNFLAQALSIPAVAAGAEAPAPPESRLEMPPLYASGITMGHAECQ